MASRQRLDLRLQELGLVDSRPQAQQLIRAGRVRGTEISPDLELHVETPPRFVSRGGEKLLAALEALPIRVQGRICLDGGISTGGFSDCLLQHGAERVYGIDVGYGQTAWSLRTDPRVVLRERTNLRHLQPAELYGPDDPWPDLAVADVSFISLTRVLPALRGLLRSRAQQAPQPDDPDATVGATGTHDNCQAGAETTGPAEAAIPSAAEPEAVLLVKPQFEVGRERVGKGGVVRDPRAHRDAILTVIEAAAPLAWAPAGLVASPITGPAGNHEYLLWLREPGALAAAATPLLTETEVNNVVQRTMGGAG